MKNLRCILITIAKILAAVTCIAQQPAAWQHSQHVDEFHATTVDVFTLDGTSDVAATQIPDGQPSVVARCSSRKLVDAYLDLGKVAEHDSRAYRRVRGLSQATVAPSIDAPGQTAIYWEIGNSSSARFFGSVPAR